MKSETFNRAALCAFSFVWILSATAKDGVLGKASEASNLMFVGNKVFTKQQITKALQDSVDYTLISHPMTPIKEFTGPLARLLRSGYLTSGFPDAKVSAGYDARFSRCYALIDEGPRYRAGEIVTPGMDARAREKLLKRLTEPYSASTFSRMVQGTLTSSEDKKEQNSMDRLFAQAKGDDDEEPPIWEVGKPVNFLGRYIDQIRKAIEEPLAEEGFLFPIFHIRIQKHDDKKTADLVIRLETRGPPGKLSEIVIKRDTKVHTRAELIEFLGLKVGMGFNQEIYRQVKHALWSSARFRYHNVTIVPPDKTDDGITLVIELVEEPNHPKINTPLSAEETAALKFRDWIAGLSSGRENLELTLLIPGTAPLKLKIVIDPGSGIIVNGGPGDDKQPSIAPFSLVLAQDEVILQWPKDKRQWVIETPSGGIIATCDIVPVRTGEKTNTFLFGMGMNGKTDAGPFNIKMNIEPYSLMSLVHHDKINGTVADGVLSLKFDDRTTLRVDADTGRPMPFVFREKSGLGEILFRTGPGLFEDELKRLKNQGRTYKRTDVGVIGMCGKLLATVVESPYGGLAIFEQEAMTAKERLETKALLTFTNEFFIPLMQNFVEHGGLFSKTEEDDPFRIPVGGIESAAQIGIAHLAVKGALLVFPYDSWPVAAVREVALVFIGRDRHTMAVLNDIYRSEDVGPIGYAMLSKLTQKMLPELSIAYARRGLRDLSVAALTKDSRLLFAKHAKFHEANARITEFIESVDWKEIETAMAALGGKESEIYSALNHIRENPKQPPAEQMRKLLNALWTSNLRDHTKKALTDLSQPPASK